MIFGKDSGHATAAETEEAEKTETRLSEAPRYAEQAEGSPISTGRRRGNLGGSRENQESRIRRDTRYSGEARKDVYVLGISMSRHDRAACLLRNGEVVGAIGEERLDRRRRSLGTYQSHPRGLVVPPLAAITYVLRLGGISWDRVDLCVCGRSMTLCREALLECVPFPADRVVEVSPLPGHHLAHAYSAYGTAPFANCAVLVIDEQGHHVDGAFEKCTWYEGATGRLTLVDRFFGGGDDLESGDAVQRVCGNDEPDRG